MPKIHIVKDSGELFEEMRIEGYTVQDLYTIIHNALISGTKDIILCCDECDKYAPEHMGVWQPDKTWLCNSCTKI